MHGLGAVTREHAEVMHFAGRTGFDDQAGRRTAAFAHEVMVHSTQRQQCRYRHLRAIHFPVGDDEDVVAALDGVHCFGTQRGQLGLHAGLAPGQRISNVEFVTLEFAAGALLNGAQTRHIVEIENRLRHFQTHGRVHRVDVEQVRLRPDEAVQAHHNGLADRVDRRVRDLREKLFEVIEERLVLV